MKIQIIHRYYYPDTSTYAFLLHKLANNYKDYFDQVDVLTTMPSYYGSQNIEAKKRERAGNISIRRLKLFNEKGRKLSFRIINSLLFTVYVFLKLLFKGRRYDYVQVATTPPVLVALAVTLASKLSCFKVVYHCQDIYPEIIYFNGKPGKIKHIALSVLKWLDKLIMQNAYKIVVLSADMKLLLIEKRNIQPNKINVINNFIFERVEQTKTETEIPNNVQDILNRNGQVMVFVGNLGTFQNLDVLFEAVQEVVKKTNAIFLVIGEGVNKEPLVDKFSNDKIHFVGYLQNEIIQNIYPKCKIGFAPVIPDIEKVAFPSKIISYLVSGVPVITFSSLHSEISELIEGNNFGFNYPFAKKPYLEKLIIRALNTNFDSKLIKQEASQIYGERTAFNKWKELYNEQ
jgi:glycosyltransferase involved in cell wall biosynthesis